jgi:hypothetical protein
VRRDSSLIDTPRTKCSRSSSAHCSTPTNPPPLAGSQRPNEVPKPPNASTTRSGSNSNRQRGPVFNRRRQRRRAGSIRCLLRKLKAGSSRPVVVIGWTGRVPTNVEATCADKEVARWPLTYVA